MTRHGVTWHSMTWHVTVGLAPGQRGMFTYTKWYILLT